MIEKEKKRVILYTIERFDVSLAQGGVLAIIAFITDDRFGLYMYTLRAVGLKIPMRQVNEGVKARVRSVCVYYVF
jgi:hypothetical protein